MENKVLVEISARHVHLSKEDLETLFGKGYELTVKKELSQPGQFASNERVRVVGAKSEFPAVSILGPCRKETQVELSLTDARFLFISLKSRSRFIFKLGMELRLKRSAKKCASALSQCIMFSIISCRLTI